MNTNTEASKARPNLFSFATGELSQDAFLCWLLLWADGKYAAVDKALHETAVEFVRSMIEMHGKDVSEENFTIEVNKQYKHIDILATLVQENKKYALLIEDKIEANISEGQLERYKKILEEDFSDHENLMVYLKTGAISQAAKAREAGYKVYSGEKLQNVFDKNAHEVRNDVFRDFYEHLKEKNDRYRRYKTKKIDDWISNYNAWEGFYSALQEKIEGLDWGYASNQRGGELVAYWGFEDIKGDGHVYLEIHYQGDGIHFLAFKVGEVPEERDKAQVRWNLYESLMQSAQKYGRGWGEAVNKPPRFGSGKTMVFCKTTNQDRWLAKNSEGMLDMEKTVKNLKEAGDILSNAAKDYVGAS